jgi:hypothetical protein
MIVQLLKPHAKATMPPKGMWSKPMKLKISWLSLSIYIGSNVAHLQV